MGFLAVEIIQGDGTPIRCGHDEQNPANIPSGIGFETTMPGGFSTGQITIPRPANLRSDSQMMFSPIRMYGEGSRTFYEGFITGISQASQNEITIQTAGHVDWLERVNTREIFVDRDQSRWTDPGRARRLAILGSFCRAYGPTNETDTTNGLPAVTLTLPATDLNPFAEAWYDAGPGVKIESIYYDFTSVTTSSHVLNIGAAANDVPEGSYISTADLITVNNAAATGTYTLATPSRYGIITHYLLGTVGITDTSVSVRNIAVYGNHGLPKQGAAPAGVYASDVVRYAIGKVAGITTGTIEPTSFAIPHLTYPEDTTIRAIVENMTALGSDQNIPQDWGIYENQEFFWRSPGTYGREWHVREDVNVTPVSDGPDADRRISGIKINYTDAAGETRSVGPPGSNSDIETVQLLDTDKTNPAYKIPGYGVETMGITSSSGAINVGTVLLNERNRLDWRGQITVTGPVRDTAGNEFPAALVRAGDRIVVEDRDEISEPRTIAQTSYNHDTDTVTCSIGAKPDTFEALLGNLAAVTDLIA